MCGDGGFRQGGTQHACIAMRATLHACHACDFKGCVAQLRILGLFRRACSGTTMCMFTDSNMVILRGGAGGGAAQGPHQPGTHPIEDVGFALGAHAVEVPCMHSRSNDTWRMHSRSNDPWCMHSRSNDTLCMHAAMAHGACMRVYITPTGLRVMHDSRCFLGLGFPVEMPRGLCAHPCW